MSKYVVESGSSSSSSTSKRPYDAMVYKDAASGYTIAVDGSGNVIKKVLSSLNTDEIVINAAINYVGTFRGKIVIAGGEFNLTNPITGFGAGYTSNVGITIEGCGPITKINWNSPDRFAIEINYDSNSDAKIIKNVTIKYIDIMCGSNVGTGGGISLKAACYTLIKGVSLYGTSVTGNGIYMCKNTYGSGSLINHLDKIYVSGFSKGVVLTNDTQALITNWSNIVGCTNPIYAESTTTILLYVSDSQISSVPATEYALKTIGTVISSYMNLYVDAGKISHNGGKHSYYGYSSITIPSSTPGTIVYLSRSITRMSSTTGGGGDNIDSNFVWDYIMGERHVIEAQDPYNDLRYGVLVDDVLASGGKCRQNISTTTKEYVILRSYSYTNGFLPRGKYAIILRAKDTNNVVGDCRLFVTNQTDGPSRLIKDITLTSDYKEYVAVFTIDSNDVNDKLRIAVYKNTNNSNTISVDYIEIKYLCSEWGNAQLRYPQYYTTSGTAAITAGNTYVNVTHSLASTPTRVRITPTTNLGTRSFWVDTKGAATFRININSSDVIDHTFDWEAEV